MYNTYMDKTEVAELLKEQRTQFTVVLEDIQTHNRAFGELLLSVRDDVAVLKDDVTVLKDDVSDLRGDVNTLKSRFKRQEEKLDAVFEEVGRLREDVTEINESKADKSVVSKLETRVVKLELAH